MLIRATDIHKSYKIGPEWLRVLRGTSLSVRRGEFVAVMGSSGSGKSTLLHVLGALDIPDRGKVEFEGKSVFDWSAGQRNEYRNRHVGFVFQFYHLLPELNVLENVLATKLVEQTFSDWWRLRGRARKDAEAMLERVGLSARARHKPRQLSGGERQRVAIARALINRPSVLLADEPTGNLDETIGRDILELLEELNRDGQTIVMVTHDPKVSARAHRCLRLEEGVLRDAGRETLRTQTAEAAAGEVVR
jgi:lipoprotein-releasing system ATP-binding protein